MEKILLACCSTEELIETKAHLLSRLSNVEIQTATSGRESLIKAITFRPDVIVYSLQKHIIKHLDTLASLKANHITNEIPILLVPKHEFSAKDRIIAYNNGVDGVLNHWYDIDELIAQIKLMIRNKRFQSEKTENKANKLRDLILTIHELSDKLLSDSELAGEIWDLLKDSFTTADSMFLSLYFPTENLLHSTYQSKYLLPHRMSAANKPFSKVLQNRELVYLTPKDLRLIQSEGEFMFCKKTCYWLGIPLINNNKLMGLISFTKPESTGEFEKSEIESIKLVVNALSAIIDSRMTNEELKRALQKANESEKLKDNFLSNISHEIRTPLNSIIGFSSMLYDPVTEYEKKEYLDLIMSGGNSLMRIIDDIVDMAKIQSGEIKINKIESNVYDIHKQLFKRYNKNPELRNKTIELVLSVPENTQDLLIKTDPFRLNQIIDNLLSNALKFTQKGTINFGYDFENSETIRFFVQDTGIGIPREKINTIFDRFNQIELGHSKEYGGNGIGLNITKSLIELLNGKLTVESEKDRGSLFSFTIPIEKQKFYTKINSRAHYEWAEKRVLLVDDVIVNLEFLEQLLKPTKAQTILALNGQKAIEIVSKNPDIDLIIMDLQMPVMDGYQATRAIKSKFPQMKIIIQTAYTEISDKQKAREAGCDDYIEKPIKTESLLKLIEKHLSN